MPETSRTLLSVRDVEIRWGFCRSTIYSLIKSGQLQSSKVGKRRVFTQKQIAAFEASLEVESDQIVETR